MMRTPTQRSRLVTSTLLACQVLVIALGLLDLVTTVLANPFRPEVIAVAVLALASVVAATRLAGVGVALAIVPVITTPLIPDAALGALPMLVTTAAAVVAWRVRHALLLTVAYATVVGVDAALLGLPTRTVGYATIVLLGLAVGWGLRALLRRSREGAERIATLEQRVAEVRRDERAALADELSALLVGDLDASANALGRALPDGDPSALARTLDAAEEYARAALARLRQLVSTLRSPDHDPQASAAPDLVEAVEEVEDLLVGHGHPVALEFADASTHVPAEPAALLVEFLRAAAERAMGQAPAGAPCTISVASGAEALALRFEHPPHPTGQADTPSAGLRQAAERIRARGGSVEDVSGGRAWAVSARIPLRSGATLPEAAPGPRHPWLIRAPAGLGRMVVTVPAVAAVTREVPLTLARAAEGSPGWADGVLWSLLWLGLAVASWSARLAAILFAVGLGLGLALWADPPSALLGAPPILLGGALTALVGARHPRWTIACLVGWAAYLPVWSRGQLDVSTLMAACAPVGLGAIVGLVIHHFVAARASQVAELNRLGAEHRAARAQERRQLAGELHDIVAHQLSLVGLQVMAHRGASDVAGLRRTVQQVAAITASARADLTTLVTVMRAHHERTAADRAEAGQATWLTPSHAAEGVATTLRESGHPVEVALTKGLDTCDPTLQKTVSRILREATTNVLRYAPPGSACRIELVGTEEAVEVEVSSPLPDAPLSSPLSTGFGLLGLQERVTLTGGTFSAGPEAGQWVVRARLPLTDGARPRERRSGAERRERGGVDDAELDGAHQHLGSRPHAELVGHPREVLLH